MRDILVLCLQELVQVEAYPRTSTPSGAGTAAGAIRCRGSDPWQRCYDRYLVIPHVS